jgi:YVTN family beta-propeller protein
VQAIDPTTGIAGAPIKVGKGPGDLTFDGTRLWVANRGDDTVQAIDPATGTVGAPIQVESEEPSIPVYGHPTTLVFDGTRLWIDFAEGDIVQYLIPPK